MSILDRRSENIYSELEVLFKNKSFDTLYAKTFNLCVEFPEDVFLWNMKAAASLKLGKYTESLLAFQRVEKLQPKSHAACFNIAKVFFETSQFDSAIRSLDKSIKLNPNYFKAYDLKIRALYRSNKIEEAIKLSKLVLNKNPKFDTFQNNLGIIYKETQQYLLALNCFKSAVQLKPKNYQYRLNLADSEFELFRFKSAIKNYQLIVSKGLESDIVCIRLGEALARVGEISSARQVFADGIIKFPRSIKLREQFGVFLNDIGEFQNSVIQFEEALRIEPENASIIRLLGARVNNSQNFDFVNNIQSLLADQNLSDLEKSHLHFARAKVFEDLENYSEAFINYEVGGKYRQKCLNYDQRQDEVSFARIKSAASKIAVCSLKNNDPKIKPAPIFIVGMPRSGTTLVEQIISNHSLVTAGGELSLVSHLAFDITEGIVKPETDNLTSIRENYLSSIEELSKGKSYVTDKMPHNFRHIAIIKSLFNDVKIVHVKRDPKATCWSNFKTFFGAEGLGYSYSLDNLVKFYNLYIGLMDFWETLFPKAIFHINYEDLTLQTDKIIRELLLYLELPFEEACLSPETNSSLVKTASQMQVREKIYSGSSLVWKRYEKYLSKEFSNL